jgi:outer membrane protein, heavy metal efflux system
MISVSLRAAALAAAILPAMAPAFAQAAPITLEDAIARAVQRSEATRAARAGAASAGETARAAGQLPDPMLGVSVENLPATGPERFNTRVEPMTMKRIALSQEWVPSDKRALRESAASAALARENATIAAAASDTRLHTALAYIDSYFAAEALKLGEDSGHHAHEALGVAKARLASGGASSPDVLALASAQGLAEDEAAEARQQLASAAVNLSRWTGLAREEFAVPSLPQPVDEQSFVERNPAVVQKQREIDMARAEAAVASTNRRPNWTWEVAYGQRTGMPDLVSVGVNIPLPIAPAARQDRETAAKLALAEKAEAELAEAQRAAQAEYRQLASDASRLAQRITSIEANVIVPAKQRTMATTAALASNLASLAMTFEARHMELEAQRKLLMLQRDLARVQAQLAFKPLRAQEMQ